MNGDQNQFVYFCKNDSCSFSEKKGMKIKLSTPNITQCPYCGNNSLKPKIPGLRIGTGFGGGVALGFTVGGPPGAFIGGLVGLVIGLFAEDQDNKK
jgi:hypothetical protein